MTIVRFNGDPRYHDGDEDYEESMYAENEHEQFSTIVKRARAKHRDGIALTEKENWALTQACKIVPPQFIRRGPGKQTRKNLEKIVRLQFEGGKTLAEISETEGKSYAWASKLIRDNPDVYRDIASKIAEEHLREAKTIVPVVNAVLLRAMRTAAMRAPRVMEEIMDDPDQPGGVRLKAAEDFVKKFEVEFGKTSSEQAPSISIDQLNVINDTIGIIKGREIEVESEVIDV